MPSKLKVGPKGGKYYLNSNGKKVYVKKEFENSKIKPISGKQRFVKAKGWHEEAPKPGPERKALFSKCKEKCFLDPVNLKFPICPKCNSGSCPCKIHCEGLAAAYDRAREWGYDKIASKAKILQQKSNCKLG
jgi:hypothetical protein